MRSSVRDHLMQAEPMISRLLEKSDNGFWVGAVFDDRRDIWSWVDGSEVGNNGDWFFGQPSRNETGNCMYISSGMSKEYGQGTRGKWYSGSCSSKKFYVCHRYIAGLYN